MSWERYEPSYYPIYGLDSSSIAFLQWWHWHLIIHNSWCSIKQRNMYSLHKSIYISTPISFFLCSCLQLNLFTSIYLLQSKESPRGAIDSIYVLWYCSDQVQTPVVLLCLWSNQSPWEKNEDLIHPLAMGYIVLLLFFYKIELGVKLPTKNCPVDWGCRIHRLYLCRGVRSFSQRVFRLWH